MTNSRPLLGIVTALPTEARCVGVRDAPVGEPVRVTDEVLLIRCGIGRARAERAALDLLKAGVRGLLSWGTAAGLSRDLAHGDLVLARDVVTRDGQHLSADSEWHQRLWRAVESEGRCHSGSVAEADGVLTDADDKLRLHTLSGALIADMETAAIAEVAHGTGTPVLIVRAVSDSVVTRVPACALAAVDGNGDVDPARCLLRLARAPAELPSLLRLARGFRAARARLSRLAELAGPAFMIAPGERVDWPQA
jgi:adenosylhomocysteine nucleosidase